MSETSNEPLPYTKGSRVRLRPGYDKVYPLSFAGAEATIGEYTIDPEKFERILVIWDKKHMRYNNERNMWTYAAHFEVIAPPEITEEEIPEDIEEPTPVLGGQEGVESEILRRLLATAGAAPPTDEEEIDNYAGMLRKAIEVMTSGAAFMVVTVAPAPDDSGRLAPYFFGAQIDETAGQAAQTAFVTIAGDVMKQIVNRKD